MAGVYWLCLAAPIWILADAGPGWLSTGSDGIFFLGLPAFVWEMTAALLPLVLLSIAAGGGSAAGAAGPDAGTDLRPDAGPNAAD
jgi:bacteriorhodopsin